MLKIGDVEKILGIPVKTIRYWEEFGLFKPSYIDRYTGYRQFDEKDIERLSQISYLKNLGFTLKEIKTLDESIVENKCAELKKLSKTITANIKKVSSLQKNSKGEYNMNTFINDKNAIGHWTLLGVAETKEQAMAKDFNKSLSQHYFIKDMYLMENGEEYWALGWTKGAILINNTRNPYTIVGDNIIVAITHDGEVDFYAVYKRVDSISHKIQDFAKKDDVNLPFKIDKKALGAWQYYDFINDVKAFNPAKKESGDDAYVKRLYILDNGECIADLEDDGLEKYKWTKGHILNIDDSLDYKYKIIEQAGETFLVMEWKSGDYIYGGMIFGYYVFKKHTNK